MSTRVTLPADLAALAGCAEVDVTEDENDILIAYRDGVELLCFSWADFGKIRDLYNKARGAALPVNAQALARVGLVATGGKKRRKAKCEDDRLRAPEGRRFEDV